MHTNSEKGFRKRNSSTSLPSGRDKTETSVRLPPYGGNKKNWLFVGVSGFIFFETIDNAS